MKNGSGGPLARCCLKKYARLFADAALLTQIPTLRASAVPVDSGLPIEAPAMTVSRLITGIHVMANGWIILIQTNRHHALNRSYLPLPVNETTQEFHDNCKGRFVTSLISVYEQYTDALFLIRGAKV